MSFFGFVGVYMFLNWEWTLSLKNSSSHILIPMGTSESSGSLRSALKRVQPDKTEKFLWKKTTFSERGAIGVIHFKIGDTGKVPSVFGRIPMDMGMYWTNCNLHIGSKAMNADEMEEGKGGCSKPVNGGEMGELFDCSFTITNHAEAEFSVCFNCKCNACNSM